MAACVCSLLSITGAEACSLRQFPLLLPAAAPGTLRRRLRIRAPRQRIDPVSLPVRNRPVKSARHTWADRVGIASAGCSRTGPCWGGFAAASHLASALQPTDNGPRLVHASVSMPAAQPGIHLFATPSPTPAAHLAQGLQQRAGVRVGQRWDRRERSSSPALLGAEMAQPFVTGFAAQADLTAQLSPRLSVPQRSLNPGLSRLQQRTSFPGACHQKALPIQRLYCCPRLGSVPRSCAVPRGSELQ